MPRTRTLAISSIPALLFAAGCGVQSDWSPVEENDLGIGFAELGGDLPSCSTSASSGFGAGQVLTLAITGGVSSVVLAATPLGKLSVNGTNCVNLEGTELTTSGPAATAVKKVVITGDPAVAEMVILDLSQASFGPTLLSGAAGTGIVVDLGAAPGVVDTFLIRGTSGPDKTTLGRSAAGDVFADTTGDRRADVALFNIETIEATLLDGNDVFSAAGGTVAAPAFTSGVSSLGPILLPVKVVGGDGNDTLQGGDGDDILQGGNGDDTFVTSSGANADGADAYYGGSGIDTINYSGRTSQLSVGIGPPRATLTGTTDLTTLTYPTQLSGATLVLSIDGEANAVTTFDTPADKDAVAAQINTAVGAEVATVDSSNRLVLASLGSGPAGTVQVVSGTALLDLGLTVSLTTGAEPDDGQAGEQDDVTYTVENILGGSNDDVLTGSDQVNVVTGGAGHDVIQGVSNAVCPQTGDALNGGTGNDTFLMGTTANCGVVVSGGAGTDVVDYRQRTAGVVVSLNGLADDGDPAGAGERGNLSATDVEIVIGGSGDDVIGGSTHDDELHGGDGDDTLSGGAGNDVLVGGPGDDASNGGAGDDVFLESGMDTLYVPSIAAGAGDDLINGGPGNDRVDYTDRIADLVISLCVDPAATGAPTASPLPAECSDSDGDPLLSEADNVVNVEWLASGSGADALSGSVCSETIEGGAGDDVIHGGAGDDVLYGDAGDDAVFGDVGDDYVEGGAGDDIVGGGASDGDICVSDSADTTAPVACEL